MERKAGQPHGDVVVDRCMASAPESADSTDNDTSAAPAWHISVNECDGCGCTLAFTTDRNLISLCLHDEELMECRRHVEATRPNVLLPDDVDGAPGRPYIRGCSRMPWYTCPECPQLDFCSRDVVAHEHAAQCVLAPVHPDTEQCPFCCSSTSAYYHDPAAFQSFDDGTLDEQTAATHISGLLDGPA